MNDRTPYSDFLDFLEHAPLQEQEVYGSALAFTEDTVPLDITFPIELANQIISKYCYSPAHNVPLSVMYRALKLEAQEALAYDAPASELFLQVLFHYLDHLHEKHKDAVRLTRYQSRN